mmetsp:Transcript_16936/g.36712  ORF Transcript_16936/g.36712 Transcript_16936/m.36712 type:complete len:690 (-) Transcript_16936:161-2230(-)
MAMRMRLSAAAFAFTLAVTTTPQAVTAFSLGGCRGLAHHHGTHTSLSISYHPRGATPRIAVPSPTTTRLYTTGKSDDATNDGSNDSDENPYADPNYPDLEFVNYDDPDYSVDQGVGDDVEPYNDDATLAEIEAMREERRRKNDEFQFETYHANVLRGGERSLGEWAVFQTDTFMGEEVVKGRNPAALGVPRLLKWDKVLKVVSRGSKIVTDPDAEWRVDGERIVHEERLATLDDFPTLMMSEGSSSSSSSDRNGSPSAFSVDRTEQKDAMMDASSWGDLPSHRTRDDGGAERDDASEWTRGSDDIGSCAAGIVSAAERHRDGLHDSRGRDDYRGRGSSPLDLVPAGNDANDPRRNRRRYGRRTSSAAAAAASPSVAGAASTTYKYQISFYIQMQLCRPSTLADWIKHRNANCVDFDAEEIQSRARPAFEIFRQIVNGLAHVHSKGIIHRDLKPANIFAGDDGFLLGDFGLSKMVRDANNTHIGADNNNHPSSQTNAIILPTGYIDDNIHTAGVGTASYASPEQITSENYTTAADIYSLGLILLELFGNFTSEHERAKAFHECRRDRAVAPWMKRYYPEVSALILACTQEDWERRPTAMDIRAAGVFQEKGNGVEIFRAELRALKVEMARKDGVIQSQKEEMREKEEMIENLRRRLEEVESGMGVKAAARTVGKIPVGVDDSYSTSDDDY